jgi:hypothetical protein
LTRDRHVALYAEDGMPADLANREFDRLSEPGAASLVKKHVQPDIDALRGAAADLERYATKRIAHFDKEPPTVIPKFSDLNAALDVFEKLVKRYRLLLRAIGGEVLPVIVEPWERVLTEPWIP